MEKKSLNSECTVFDSEWYDMDMSHDNKHDIPLVDYDPDKIFKN